MKGTDDILYRVTFLIVPYFSFIISFYINTIFAQMIISEYISDLQPC